MDKVQEHIEKVREALRTIATTSGYKRFDATERLEANAEAWLEQSLDIIEQQQREIERMRTAMIDVIDNAGRLESWAKERLKEALSPNKEVSTDVQDDR